MHVKKVSATLLAVAVLSISAVAPSFAASASISGKSSSYSSGTYAYNTDIGDDSQYTSVPWLRASGQEGSLVNRSGYGATVSKGTGGTVSHVKACVSRTALPMRCTGWNAHIQ